jgi:hypothetical protein
VLCASFPQIGILWHAAGSASGGTVGISFWGNTSLVRLQNLESVLDFVVGISFWGNTSIDAINEEMEALEANAGPNMSTDDISRLQDLSDASVKYHRFAKYGLLKGSDK